MRNILLFTAEYVGSTEPFEEARGTVVVYYDGRSILEIPTDRTPARYMRGEDLNNSELVAMVLSDFCAHLTKGYLR
jgi:hypothetical protein